MWKAAERAPCTRRWDPRLRPCHVQTQRDTWAARTGPTGTPGCCGLGGPLSPRPRCPLHSQELPTTQSPTTRSPLTAATGQQEHLAASHCLSTVTAAYRVSDMPNTRTLGAGLSFQPRKPGTRAEAQECDAAQWTPRAGGPRGAQSAALGGGQAGLPLLPSSRHLAAALQRHLPEAPVQSPQAGPTETPPALPRLPKPLPLPDSCPPGQAAHGCAQTPGGLDLGSLVGGGSSVCRQSGMGMEQATWWRRGPNGGVAAGHTAVPVVSTAPGLRRRG